MRRRNPALDGPDPAGLYTLYGDPERAGDKVPLSALVDITDALEICAGRGVPEHQYSWYDEPRAARFKDWAYSNAVPMARAASGEKLWLRADLERYACLYWTEQRGPLRSLLEA